MSPAAPAPPTVARAEGAPPDEPPAATPGPARVVLQRRAVEPAPARPALRRVERPAPEPEPVEAEEPPPVEEPIAAPQPRGLLRRVADAFRGGGPPPPARRRPPAPRAIARAERPAPRMAVRDAAPPPPAASTPAGFPAAIARAGLGAVDSAAGSSTVTFPGPPGAPEYAPFSTAPISRSIWDQARDAATGYAEDAASDARAAVTERASSALDEARAALPGGAPSSGAGDADKQFEELYDRLKRELMIEQEQLGQLFHEP